MPMNRRDMLKYLLATPIVATLDVEKLLWIPDEKKIFIPPARFTIADIVNLELTRIAPFLQDLFNRDDTFYRKLFENDPAEMARYQQKLVSDILETEYADDWDSTR